MTVNGAEVKTTGSFETTWVYEETTILLSFASRQSAFMFTGEGVTEITIPPEHTHVTVDGIETHVDLPGLTTTISVSGSSNIIVQLPEVVTSTIIPAATLMFTAIFDSIIDDSGTKYCGTYREQSLAAGDDNSPCVMGAVFTATVPSDIPDKELYLNAGGLTSVFELPGVTTACVTSLNTTCYCHPWLVLKEEGA